MSYTMCICAIMKNEHFYLHEWIQHHLDLGAAHIYLYEDKGSDPHDDICNKYENVTLYKLSDPEYDFLDKIGNKKQVTVYNYFILKHHDKYDFCLFIDLDEFLYFADGWNLSKLLNDTIDKTHELLWWKIYNANGHIFRQDFVKESYTQEASEIYEWGTLCPKVLLNLNKKIPLANVHEAVTARGLKKTYTKHYNKAFIKHYYTKSWVEWCNRFINRGDLIADNRQIYEFFRTNPDLIKDKDYLMDIFFLLKKEELKKIGKKEKKLKIVHYFSSIPSTDNWYGLDPKKSLIYDILTQTISFYYAKLSGREVVLYTDKYSAQYLQHLNYDKVIIVPDEYIPKNGNASSILCYAMQQEDLNACYISGDFFLGNDYVLRFIEVDLGTDIFVNNILSPPRQYYWDDMININDNIMTYLSPELLCDNESDVDYSFLSFNDEELKKTLIKEYELAVKKYNSSLLCEWWKISKNFNPDVKLFGNKLGFLIKDKTQFTLNNIKCDWNREKQIEEKLNFFESKSVPSLRYDPNFENTFETLLNTLDTNLYDRTKQIIKVYVNP